MLKFLFALLSKSKRKTLSDEEAVAVYLETSNNYYFELLYNRYSSKIFGKCLTILKDEYHAQDATQDILMKVLLNLSRFGGKSKFSTWVYSITYNFCIDQVRRSKKKKPVLIEDMEIFSDLEDEVSDKYILEIKLDRLKVVMNEISEEDKAILLMKYMDALSIKEIAEIFNKTESAIKMKIKRAKQRFVKMHNLKYTEI